MGSDERGPGTNRDHNGDETAEKKVESGFGLLDAKEDRVEEMSDERELTPEERLAFQKLPREAEASDLLEERIVRSLKDEGILGRQPVSGVGGHPASHPGSSHRNPWLRPWMATAAVAASLALFTSGIFLGQWMGTRSTAQAFLAVREQDAAQLAMTIQEAGSQYVSALAALSQPRAGEQGEGGEEAGPVFTDHELQQGREVALGALYGAAFELARLNPDDMELFSVLQILEERKAREEGYGAGARNVVWF